MDPSPPYLGLILAASGKLEKFLSCGCRLSPRASYDYDDAFEDEATQNLTRVVGTTSANFPTDSDMTIT